MIRPLLSGFGALFSVTTPPLYRYPYRFNDEGLRGDMARVAGDISSVLDRSDNEAE